jgi:hypothetical protein
MASASFAINLSTKRVVIHVNTVLKEAEVRLWVIQMTQINLKCPDSHIVYCYSLNENVCNRTLEKRMNSQYNHNY